MKLSQLLREADVKNAYADVEISFVTDKAKMCRENCAFVCIEGRNNDGHDFIEEAKKKGARVFITQKDTGEKNQIKVGDTRKVYALMCREYFGRPSDSMKLIAVTGTNGKTTVTNMIYSLLTLFGEKAGLIGTVETIIDGERMSSEYTTPGAFEFNHILRQMADSGTKYCVCEVSSQALDQYRTYGNKYSVGVFTNITQEHLDYHGSFENYLSAKKKLFSYCENAVISLDDKYSEDIISSIGCSVSTYSSRKNEADLNARCINYGKGEISYAALMFSKIGRVRINGIGEYSVRNSLAAILTMIKLGFDFNEICDKMFLVPSVRGRGEKIETGRGFDVYIDYAHTPDALYNVLYALSRDKKGRLIVLFGCGGDRDREKRSEMGKVASLLSDIAVITDDNPRNESEDEIISDILGGMVSPKCRVYVEKDRTAAIKLALSHAKEGDTVLLAGKGHEAYQIIKNKKTPFDERLKVNELLG